MENKGKNVGKEQNNTLLRKYKQYLQLEQSRRQGTTSFIIHSIVLSLSALLR